MMFRPPKSLHTVSVTRRQTPCRPRPAPHPPPRMALSLGALLPWGEDDLDLESLPEGHLSLDALLAQHSTPGWSLPQHGAGTVTAVAQQQRCLDGTHPQGCGLCSAPPDRDDAVEFLSGSFKALRGQLLSCREWDSAPRSPLSEGLRLGFCLMQLKDQHHETRAP